MSRSRDPREPKFIDNVGLVPWDNNETSAKAASSSSSETVGVFIHGHSLWESPDTHLQCNLIRIRHVSKAEGDKIYGLSDQDHWYTRSGPLYDDNYTDNTFLRCGDNYDHSFFVQYCHTCDLNKLARAFSLIPNAVLGWKNADVHAHSMGGLLLAVALGGHGLSYPGRLFFFDVPWFGLSLNLEVLNLHTKLHEWLRWESIQKPSFPFEQTTLLEECREWVRQLAWKCRVHDIRLVHSNEENVYAFHQQLVPLVPFGLPGRVVERRWRMPALPGSPKSTELFNLHFEHHQWMFADNEIFRKTVFPNYCHFCGTVCYCPLSKNPI